MMRKNKLARPRPLAAPVLAAGWHRLLLGFSLLLVAAGCSTTPANIGVGLPTVDNTTGAYLVDTLTLRASTVLRDSVVTSTSSYLLVGRYIDPQLGTITAKSYTTLSYGGAFTPDRNQIADSIVLVLKPDTYRYGDTTKTQTLVEVHELTGFIPVTKFGFASPKLTSMTSSVKAAVLNETTPVPRRARPNLSTLRLRLDPAFGQRIMTDAKAGLLTTQEQFETRYPGLALFPGANDAAALVRFTTANTDASLVLYYHDPTDVSTAQYHGFTLDGSSRHFYQAEAARTGPLAGLTTSLGQLSASQTGEQTYIEGLLGLQTKIEIPYLFDLRNFGQRFIITSAMLTAEVPANTLTPNLTPPLSLSVATTDQTNRQGTTFISATGYSPNISALDGITQAGYSWSVLTYCQNVLNNNIPNGGMLLNTATPALPDRVVLGGPRRTTNKMKLRLYLISNN